MVLPRSSTVFLLALVAIVAGHGQHSSEEIEDGDYASIPDGAATLPDEETELLETYRELAGIVGLSETDLDAYVASIGWVKATHLFTTWDTIYAEYELKSQSLETLAAFEARLEAGETLTAEEEMAMHESLESTEADNLWLLPTLERLASVQGRYMAYTDANETVPETLAVEQDELLAVMEFYDMPELIRRRRYELLKTRVNNSMALAEKEELELALFDNLEELEGERSYANELLLAQLTQLQQNGQLTDTQSYELKELEMLYQLRQLGQLNQLLQLRQLYQLDEMAQAMELRELVVLAQLAQLVELEENGQLTDAQSVQLVQLRQLRELRQLNQLFMLQQLHQLGQLGQLRQLTDVESAMLAQLVQLNEMINLNELRQLGELGQLFELTELGEMSQLNQLAQMSQLAEMSQLSEMAQMAQMTELYENFQMQQMSELSTLAEMMEQAGLVSLQNLQSLVSLSTLR